MLAKTASEKWGRLKFHCRVVDLTLNWYYFDERDMIGLLAIFEIWTHRFVSWSFLLWSSSFLALDHVILTHDKVPVRIATHSIPMKVAYNHLLLKFLLSKLNYNLLLLFVFCFTTKLSRWTLKSFADTNHHKSTMFYKDVH